ncbi:dihydrofolate reductase family protein [Microbacterium terricola]|uniref:Dihydrofolate reductase n=1 Tax=Microbacterium terricola TaxID=344163 RepID=A0ABM8E2H2_9MICO|nr:dihydrofolate reductase family protein [Microbacterium terricola]UYK40128.1 dihydrofolate reductase family protein [Microbacterium terricola]BDV32168.1 dihydrofolate reductase [Microbacterium terricola]
MTGRIVIDLFTTLDGVAQAPGGPEEDPSDGFPYGGWQAPLLDDTAGERVGEGIARLDALLLGRRTYDIFAAYWPTHSGVDSPIAEILNRVPKYVASRGTPTLEWSGSSQLGPDLAAEIARLREQHAETHVIGSVDFVQSLLAEDLYDELNLWVHPVVLGQGKKVFPDGATPATLRLLEPAVTSEKGVLLLRYGPGGPVRTGDMDKPDRGL